MKVQKRKRLKRAAALLFSFVLIAGTSVNVFAQENDTVTEIVSESSLETEAVTENPDTAPNENQREESDITPDENQPAEPDTTPDENQPAEPDTAPDENQPAEPDTTPDESQPTEPDTAPDENQPAEPGTTPDESQPIEPDTAPDENQPAEPDTTPDENQPTEPGTTPDESQPIEPDTAPDENQPAEPDTTPDENQPAEPGTTPDENQPEQPDAKPGENQTEKPGISPEKEPSKKADEELSKPATRTLSARSDIQGSSDYMWYTNLNSSTGFDIQGIDNGTKIQTTYGNYGYLTFYETEENGTVKIDTYTAVDMGNSLYGKRELSLLDNGKYVMVKYTVENMGDSVQTFKIGSSADVQIGDNDQAPVVGTSTGLSMSGEPKNNYKFNLFAPTVTTLWYGYYSDANKNVFTDLPNKSTPYTDDSGMAWSWTGTVSPGMTWSRYVLIGVGDLPEPPGNPAITTEELKTGIPEEIIGTAEPYNTVFIEILGSEYTVTADENGDFSLPITLPADTPEGPTGTSCYAISPEGGISDVVDGSIEIIGAPFIILKETETMVGKDSELNEEWYQSFIESSRGDVSYDDSQVKIGETGTYEVIYTAQREGFEDATATLIIEVHIHEFGTEWKFDETSHWRECKCGEKGEVDSHSFGEWVTDQEPTEEAEGTRHRNCEICSYSESGTIPQLDHKHIYGDWQSNETSHWRECKCGEKGEVDSHSFGEWVTDQEPTEEAEGTRHRNCEICSYSESGTIPQLDHKHIYGDWQSNETSHWRECKCGEKGEVDSHSFGEWVTDQEPTEEAEGTRHRNCEICSYSESGTIPQLDHKHIYGDWQSNETSHWRECKCGEKSEVDSHSFGAWITDKAATASETGTRHRECGVCGYQEEGTIPATGREESTVNNAEESESEEENPPIDDREGNFSKNIEKVDGIPDINVANSETELQLMLLTNAEKQQLRNGANIRVVFDIKDAESTVSSTDKTLIESALNGYTTGQYLDISLYKLIERTRIDINETPKKITVTIEVPENLRNADSTNKRKFAVIRVHNGMTEFLRDLDDDDNTVTIETDRFSTYALVYQDGESGTAYGNIISQNPNTGNHSIMDLFMILVMMVSGIGFLSLYFSSRKKN